MAGTSESVIRTFFAAWADPQPDELGRFFADDAVWVDGSFSVGGKRISAVVMAVFELDTAGRIKQWREAYDLKSLTDQIEDAVERPT